MEQAPEQKTITLESMINSAINSDQNGVPVDWKQMTMLVYRLCTQRIQELEGVLNSFKEEAEQPLPEDTEEEQSIQSNGTG